ncbi:hypothetical protein QQY24_18390 [Streptomyces sp. TG1A-8]|uniref:hypothetical protein n=1 Tax=Streptomyces sp. TG1A-8 TaxID=3051385 RepID=UPI00265BB254|nr:hypothetical protein [Streptomyces sp. TG1A-8]MDO0927286.1 hypothetical protein [Streptomyces sp. TG1A-8]
MAAASGCSSPSDEDTAAKPAGKAKALSVAEAATTFQHAVTKFDEDGGCIEQEPGMCGEQMQALMEPARDLRKAANTDKSAGAEFWSPAYALIDTMEDGITVGEDQGATAVGTNRPDVLGSAHKLSDWLDEHPTT